MLEKFHFAPTSEEVDLIGNVRDPEYREDDKAIQGVGVGCLHANIHGLVALLPLIDGMNIGCSINF